MAVWGGRGGGGRGHSYERHEALLETRLKNCELKNFSASRISYVGLRARARARTRDAT